MTSLPWSYSAFLWNWLYPCDCLIQEYDRSTTMWISRLDHKMHVLQLWSPVVCSYSSCHPMLCSLTHVQFSVAPVSMEFSKQEYWDGLPFPPPRDLSGPGTESTSLVSPALVDSLPLSHLGSSHALRKPKKPEQKYKGKSSLKAKLGLGSPLYTFTVLCIFPTDLLKQ